MAKFIVEGGHRLRGEIVPQGAKNEALQIICATLLTSERVVLHNVPIIADVMQLIELLRMMGVKVERLSDDDFAFQADNIDLEYLRSADYHKRCRRLRGSVMMIGPLASTSRLQSSLTRLVSRYSTILPQRCGHHVKTALRNSKNTLTNSSSCSHSKKNILRKKALTISTVETLS